MVAQQLPLVAPAHNNQQLFSDHYLDTTLPGRGDWQMLAATVGPLMVRIAAIYGTFTPSNNEAQTERDLVQPVLAALGHTFEVQAALRTPDGTKKPDYVFYRDRAALDAHKNTVLTEELLAGSGLAVGDAKYWERPLDVAIKAQGGDPFTNKNPAYQIAFYIQHSGVAWGLLTNGRLWRLYHRDTAHRLDRYYEVDLPALLAEGDPARFLYFAAFFGRDAFEPHPLGVAALLKESADYAQGVGDTLKSQVYEALRHVAQGFLDHPQNHLVSDPATLKAIYDNSLIVLYRLLFILYAEARELLPVRESAMYRDSYSLHAITRDIASGLRLNKLLLSGTATLWPRLQTLFGIINEGSPPLHVATFNGGLFDPERHPFLERHTVGDARLQAAIDKLARVKDEFVDYRDLAERHLGTIYEGLLEFHLAAIPREGEWTLALLNDRGERKATGSYYTPDYIVKYIVEQTIGPVLRAAVAGTGTDAEKIAAVLAVNVLDPAMGSGHFPVEATAYIARFLIDLAVTPDADARGETDLAYWKRRVAQNCIYGVDLNPLAVDLAKLSLWLATVAKDRPLSFLDHHLRTGNALVGARLADLQIGAQGDKARQGPSKRVRQAAAAGQLSMLDDDTFRQSMGSAVSSMWRIEGTAGDTIAEVKAQERAYADLRDGLNRKYGRLADLISATHFGLTIDTALWTPLADFATGRTIAAPPRFTEWLDAADRLAEERHFFHWELEFPEVYFNRDGLPLGEQAGFEAVIGNPPYVRQEELARFKPYFASDYPEVYHGVADLYVYFFAQGLRQLREAGRIGYISSGTFRKLNFGAPLRQHLTSQSKIVEVVEFGQQQIFSDAITYPIIYIAEKRVPEPDSTLLVRTYIDSSTVSAGYTSVAPRGADTWAFITENLRHVLHGWAKSKPLREILTKPIYRGVTTGFNEAFVVTEATFQKITQEDPASVAILKPFLRGEDLRPWYQKEEHLWLVFARRGVDINAYPGVKAHLQQFRERLEPRPENWLNPSSAWHGRKSGAYQWYEIQDSVDYYPAFEHPRIHSTKVSLFPTFSFLEKNAYAGNTSYVIPTPDDKTAAYLLGLLNSRVSEYFCRNIFAAKANSYFEIQPSGLSQFPVPDVSTAESDAIGVLAMAITAQARKRYILHTQTRHRISSDLGAAGKTLNQRLTAWWNLDFSAFRAELQKVFKRDIPVKNRDEWEEWFTSRKSEHQRHTEMIVHLETELNSRVYALFALNADAIQLIEESTRYRYGEV